MTEVVNTPAAPGGDTSGAAPAGEQLILGKFKSHDDLAKAYTELEKKLGSTTPEKPAQPNPSAPPALTIEKPADPPPPAAGAALEAVYEKSLKGDLTDADYAALEKQGFTRNVVDSFVSGRNAVAAQRATEIYNIVGGAENYKSMMTWAVANLSKAEADAFNAAVTSGNEAAMKIAVRGLAATFREKVGQEPGTLEGEGKTSFSGVTPFKDRAELYKATGSPEYRDPANHAYRAEVQKRLAATRQANPNF